MSVVEVDRPTGALVVEGRKLFPLVLSNGPPPGAKAPSGQDALAELAAGGAGFIRGAKSERIYRETKVLSMMSRLGMC